MKYSKTTNEKYDTTRAKNTHLRQPARSETTVQTKRYDVVDTKCIHYLDTGGLRGTLLIFINVRFLLLVSEEMIHRT